MRILRHPLFQGFAKGRPKREKKFYETEDFLALQKKWYKKLKSDGFQDLEHTNLDTGEIGPFLTRHSSADMARIYTPETARYYELASQFLWEMRKTPWRFRSPALRIWKHHAEGLSAEKMAPRVGLGPQAVRARLDEIKVLFWEYVREQHEEALRNQELEDE